MRMTKRAAACFLILVMVLSLIPQAVFEGSRRWFRRCTMK